MAVDSGLLLLQGIFGPIESLTVPVLQEELKKLQGTLADDHTLSYDRCVGICDGFIAELGSCINLSIEAYPDQKDMYDRVFDGLQDVINLIHGSKEGVLGSDGKPRMMNHQEARATASDRVAEIIEELVCEVSRPDVAQDKARMEEVVNSGEPRKRPRNGAGS